MQSHKYRLVGPRPGIQISTPLGIIHTDEAGIVSLTHEQKALLETEWGWRVDPVVGVVTQAVQVANIEVADVVKVHSPGWEVIPHTEQVAVPMDASHIDDPSVRIAQAQEAAARNATAAAIPPTKPQIHEDVTVPVKRGPGRPPKVHPA